MSVVDEIVSAPTAEEKKDDHKDDKYKGDGKKQQQQQQQQLPVSVPNHDQMIMRKDNRYRNDPGCFVM